MRAILTPILLATVLVAAGCPGTDPAPTDTTADVTPDTAQPDIGGGDADAATPDVEPDGAPDAVADADVPGPDGAPDAEPDGAPDVPGDATPDATPDQADGEVADPECGNGEQEGDEECDDGDDNSNTDPNACREDCTLPTCGDGVTDDGEDCDDQNDNPFDGCNGACETVPVVAVPAPGEVVITELMINPAAAGDPFGEWIELVSLASEDVVLGPCVLRDEGTDLIPFDDDGTGNPVTLAPGQRLLLGFSSDVAQNGGITPDLVYSTMLLDNLSDEVVLDCGGVVVDQVVYSNITWPVSSGVSISLDPAKTTAADNDVSFSWCAGMTAYGDGDMGTPGAANDVCPPPDTTVDQCLLVTAGATADGFLEQPLALTVHFLEAGVTDASDGIDTNPDIWAEVGLGPDGSDPASDTSWQWQPTTAIADWDDATGFDGYVGGVVPSMLGAMDAAARVTRDGGATWVYCDRTDDGTYAAADALAVTVVDDPCKTATCDTPPADFCDGDQLTLQSHPATGVCQPTGPGAFVCVYEPLPINCGDQGVGCSAGVCEGVVPAPLAGETVFNEVMVEPTIDDYLGEWFELRNATTAPVNLAGCTIGDGDADTHVVAEDLIIGPGKVVVIGRTANPVINGGVDFDYVVDDDVVLEKSDALLLSCGGALIDAVVWTSSWPHKKGVAMSLSPYTPLPEAASLNDDETRWCEAAVLYGQGEAGSPGQANAPCFGDEVAIESCTVVAGSALTLLAGVTTPLAVHVSQEGITDVTVATDLDPSIRVQAAFGPDGSDPEADSGWNWVEGRPDLDWDAEVAGVATNLDQYLADVRPPEPGTWDFTFRASADGGNTWTLCDRDGIDNGYSPDQSVAVLSEASACSPDPCGPTPATVCVGDVVSAPTTDAQCVLDAGDDTIPVCSWPSTPVEDCTIYGAVCDAGACTDFPVNPVAGELVISEVMVAPTAGPNGEWIELFNASDDVVTLVGCVLTAQSGAQSWAFPDDEPTAPPLVWPGGTYVAARSETAVAGYDALFEGVAFGNAGDTLGISCGGSPVDTLIYDASWPVVADETVSLSGPWAAAGSNDDVGVWCRGGVGTPNAVNPACAPPDDAVDSCQLLAPTTASVDAGVAASFGLAVTDTGVTDATSGGDSAVVPGYLAQLGFGPDGSDPSSDDTGWSWFDGAPTADWDDAATPGADGWSADVVSTDAAGTFDVAARVSADGGQTWTYCDANGSADGYNAVDAGELTVAATACLPNPCTAPPGPTCMGDSIVVSSGPGVCTDGMNGVECAYTETMFDCTGLGGCAAGTCVDLVPPGVAGDVVISEVMADSVDDGADDGEFVEVYNPGTTPFDLRGCTLSDAGSDLHTIAGDAPVLVPAGGYALLVANSDAATNGGIDETQVAYVYSDVVMGNVFDQLIVSCGGTPIDTVVWTVGWPLSAGQSLTLSSTALNAADNDGVGFWCLGTGTYGDGSNQGTPGVANGTCGL